MPYDEENDNNIIKTKRKGQGTDDRYSSESHKAHTSHYYKCCGIKLWLY